jgi:glutaredoxin
MTEVIFYTRAGCHLCDDAKQVLRSEGVTFTEVDIDSDAALRALYNEEVPVIFIAGRKAFKYHVDPHELRRRLARA